MTSVTLDYADMQAVETFGMRVRATREELGWKQPQLADAVRALGVTVSEGEIGRLERGEVKNPGLAKVGAIAKALGTTTDYLIMGDSGAGAAADEWAEGQGPG